ncbi:MAG: YdcF family protein [Candidatus Onthomonas sp.]
MKVLLVLIALALIAFLVLEAVVIAGGRSELKKDPDVVLILGCKIWGEEPSPALQRRLDTALDYLAELEERDCTPLIVVSGGKGDDEPVSEAQSMADYLTGQGVDAGRILLEDQSTSTATNLKNTMALLEREGLEQPHVTIVSNSFHLTRVRMLADRYGMDCSTLSAPMPDWSSRIYSTVREAPALVKSFLMD